MKIKNQWLWILVLGLLFGAGPVFAESNDQDLKKEIAELKAKVAELEAKQKAATPPDQQPGANAAAWDPFAEMERMDQEMGECSTTPLAGL